MVAIRGAKRADADRIYAVFEEVASEIPTLTEGAERRRLLLERIERCCASGHSLVAEEATGKIAGFLLAEPDQAAMFLADRLVLQLPFGGVAKKSRGRGVFAGLVAEILKRRTPLTATVKRQNKSEMVSRLREVGFEIVSANDDETCLAYTPPSAA